MKLRGNQNRDQPCAARHQWHFHLEDLAGRKLIYSGWTVIVGAGLGFARRPSWMELPHFYSFSLAFSMGIRA
jgi:hypothetical protein